MPGAIVPDIHIYTYSQLTEVVVTQINALVKGGGGRGRGLGLLPLLLAMRPPVRQCVLGGLIAKPGGRRMLFTARTAAAKAIEVTHCTGRSGRPELQTQLEEAPRMQLLLLLLMVMVLLVVMVLVVMMLMQCRRRVGIQCVQMSTKHTGGRPWRGSTRRLQWQPAIAAGAGRELRTAAASCRRLLLRLQVLRMRMLQLIAGVEQVRMMRGIQMRMLVRMMRMVRVLVAHRIHVHGGCCSGRNAGCLLLLLLLDLLLVVVVVVIVSGAVVVVVIVVSLATGRGAAQGALRRHDLSLAGHRHRGARTG